MTVTVAAHRDAATGIVQSACERLEAAGFRTVAAVLSGHPAETIVLHAMAQLPDLIIVGTRGLSGAHRQIVGSVSGRVARYAPTSVLVARTPEPIRRIVLGYDASPDAELALDQLAGLPLREATTITVGTVYEVAAPLASGVAPTMVAEVEAAYRDELREARAAALAVATDAAQRLSDRGLRAEPRAVHGSPHEQLAVIASELAADLLVVGSRGLSGIQRFLLGSTSAALLTNPPTSVLVARMTGG